VAPRRALLCESSSGEILYASGDQERESPYQYVAFVDTDNPAQLQQDTQSPAFGEFLKEWTPKVKDIQMMFGIEAFYGKK
jgi:hypothetical protein